MDKYLELFESIERDGISQADFDWLLAETRNRQDLVGEIILYVCTGAENLALELAKVLGADEILLDKLAKWVDTDEAWHILFTIAQTSLAAYQKVDAAIQHWSDEARLMPCDWWQDILQGSYAIYHQLVRNLSLEDDDVAILLQKGVNTSLGGLTKLGINSIRDRDLLAIFNLDWLVNIDTLHLNHIDRVPNEIGQTKAFPNVERLVLSQCTATPEAIADLCSGSFFSQTKASDARNDRLYRTRQPLVCRASNR